MDLQSETDEAGVRRVNPAHSAGHDIRTITLDELVALTKSMADSFLYRDGRKAILKYLDLTAVADSILGGSVTAVIVDETYCVVYSFTTPWFSRAMFLYEAVIVRLYKDGPANLDDLHDAIEAYTKAAGGSGVMLGTAFTDHDEVAARRHKQYGCERESINAFKEV